MKNIIHIKTITEAHQALGLPKPKHPLVSVVKQRDLNPKVQEAGTKIKTDLYQIWLKDGHDCEMGYGRNSYDFTEGTLGFIKSGQTFSSGNIHINRSSEGWLLLFHPDLIRKSELGKNIYHYTFFNYEIHEALHISEQERNSLTELVRKIDTETDQNIDRHSQQIIISNIDLLLSYCTRYYDRQFYTRTNLNQDLVSKFENLLHHYFEDKKQLENGIPSVKYCGDQMNMSPTYLSDLLKKESGKGTLEHIHSFIIERAKTMLMGSNETVSSIAYDLGFDYPQHFAKLFKTKTGLSPLQYKNVN